MTLIKQQFIERAKERWKGDNENWVLAGGWLDDRLDIVAWMWRQNTKRVEKAPSKGSTSAEASTSQPSGASATSNSTTDSGIGDGATGVSKKWWDVVQ